MKRLQLLFAIAFSLTPAAAVRSQEAPAESDAPATQASPPSRDDLSVEQARLADRYERLEEVLGQLAEFSAATDPNRARLLREAISQSREQDINVRFESIVKLLEDERLSAAANNQTELRTELEQLLTLLLKADRDKELDSERDRVRKYLKEVTRLIRIQKGVRARTEGGEDAKRLAADQQRVADETGKLGGSMKPKEDREGESSEGGKRDGEKDDKQADDSEKAGDGKKSKSGDGSSKPGEPSKSGESKPGESKPGESQPSGGQPSQPGDSPPSDSKPSPGQPGQPGQPGSPGGQSGGEQQPGAPQEPTDRAAERLKAAQDQMEQARKKLDEAEREGATESQREAIAKLEQAKAELERVLRQLREEEMERMLTQLAARFRKMLEVQNAVYEGTVRLDKISEASRGHDEEIEAARLSRQESDIVREAEKALVLLREEGSSVAFPEAIEQMRDDMQQVVEWLADVKVDDMTQGVEKDIIEQLEETIATLEKAAKDLEKKRTPPGGQPAAGQQPEPPLVDKLAELKLIRSLQVRINRRTQRYAEMIGGDQAETETLLEALQDLAERQGRVHKATHDLGQGVND